MRPFWETLRGRSQNLAIWASQRMLFDPTKTFCFFYVYFIAKVLCCFGIRTEEIQLWWLDTVFQGQYLPSLSVNHVAIYKDFEKLTPQLY